MGRPPAGLHVGCLRLRPDAAAQGPGVEDAADPAKDFDDIKLRLDTITNLPDGAGPINFVKDFGDTAALMLTVASPPADPLAVELLGKTIERAINAERVASGMSGEGRVVLAHGLPQSVNTEATKIAVGQFARLAEQRGVLRDGRIIAGPGSRPSCARSRNRRACATTGVPRASS